MIVLELIVGGSISRVYYGLIENLMVKILFYATH